jgi:hypothetical protein
MILGHMRSLYGSTTAAEFLRHAREDRITSDEWSIDYNVTAIRWMDGDGRYWFKLTKTGSERPSVILSVDREIDIMPLALAAAAQLDPKPQPEPAQ